MNIKNITQKMNDLGISLNDFMEDYYISQEYNNEESQIFKSLSEEDKKLSPQKLLKKHIGEFKQVYSFGGYEGGGDTIIKIFYFNEPDIYIKWSAYYSSYESTNWEDGDEPYEVEPFQETITSYRKK